MKILGFLFSVLVSFSSFSQTLIISDIDDTIKISHVIDFQDATDNAYKLGNLFLGMNDLYNFLGQQILKKEGGSFVYLSNAPVDLMQMSHTQFLNRNRFPKGRVWLSDTYLAEDHKINALRELLSSRKFNRIIFFGDNGELDSVIYDQIQKEFPEYHYETYIHLAYTSLGDGTLLRGQQVGFVTPVEVIQDLHEKKRISVEAKDSFISKLVPVILKAPLDKSDGSVAFPMWMDCRDIKLPKGLPENYVSFIIKRCHRD
ncbi:MAG: hypothetical protein BroJett040_26170 [Oligoflexia bacterium]|nr:MAG: hypothetical protein BroJett040_26170 [Oligoflexia bacterium]